MRILQIGTLALCAFLGCAVANADVLTGSTVTSTLFFPDLTTVNAGPVTAVVGASTPTFPAGAFVAGRNFSINITGDQIVYNAGENVTYGTSPFNGFVFDFAGAPTILGVTVDAASTLIPTGVTFTGNSVSLNVSGESVTTNSVAILDIQLPSSQTPEPATLVLLLSTLGVVAVGKKLLSV
jgi:hypothetical protein